MLFLSMFFNVYLKSSHVDNHSHVQLMFFIIQFHIIVHQYIGVYKCDNAIE